MPYYPILNSSPFLQSQYKMGKIFNCFKLLDDKKANIPGYSAQALSKCLSYCEDGPTGNYKDPILSKGCNCDEIATHYDSRYSRYAEKDKMDYPKSKATTDTSSLHQGSNNNKGTTSEKHLDTQDSAIEPQEPRIEPQESRIDLQDSRIELQDSRIEPQYTAIEETEKPTTEPQESATITHYDDYDESDEKNYPDSTIEPLESTTEPKESTTEYQELTELQPVLKEVPILMNKNYDEIIDPIVKAVLKKLELKHAQWHEAIEKSQESTTELQKSTTEHQESTTELQDSKTEPQDSTTELQESTAEPQESTILPQLSTTEPQGPKDFQPVLIEGPILMNKNYNKNRSFGVRGAPPDFGRSVNPIPQILADQLILPGGQITVLTNVKRIVKAVLKQLKVKHIAIEEPKESTPEPQEPTELQPVLTADGPILMNNNNIERIVKAVLKKLELKHLSVDEPLDSTMSQESTTEPQETTTESKESTTEPQVPTELQSILLNKNNVKNIDRIVKAVLKKLELKHTAIEEPKESTTEPQSTTESQKSTTEPQESTSEPQDPTELEPVLTQGPILMNKNENNIIKRIVKALMKTVEWKNVMIEEHQDPTELQPVAAAVLKKLELHHTGV